MGLPHSTPNVTVFIADDSPVVQERLTGLLGELQGIEVVGQAQNVDDAIRGIRQLKPAAVILDIRLAGGSGIEVLRRIKQDDPAPLAIVLTNYPYPAYRKKALEAGADLFFDKSTEFEQIAIVLEQLEQTGE
jgi:DNA-binding NarL/FixJ family response regulator